MQLKQIKIAGFKSFADPVTLHMPRKIAGIVGPNGSGKSNIIDAMRWVVGESSAKSLRGETLDDVIFNGSEQRKPAARSSVELLFDNSMSRCPAQWAKYAEISVRRTVTRDGISEYFINNTRTRRRDVKELFLGTGFGPRSYSIIEQGMISRIVEGKPEELSSFIEEASGVSRFREKRHETLLKLNRTQENMERLDDMRAEVEATVRKLKYQADQARRYTKMKEKAAQLRASLLTFEWTGLRQQIEQAESVISELDVERNKRLAQVRAAEADQEKSRKGQLHQQAKLNALQMEHYRVNAEISNLDRQIKESGEELERDQTNLSRLKSESAQLRNSIEEFEQRERSVAESSGRQHKLLLEAEADLQSKSQATDEMSSRFEQAQIESAQIDQDLIDGIRRRESVLATVDEVQRRMNDAENQQTSLAQELDRLASQDHTDSSEPLQSRVEGLAQTSESLNREVIESENALTDKRAEYDRLIDELDSLRESSQEAQVRLKTLERGLHEAQSTKAIEKWLTDNGFDQAPALSSQIEVTEGWERALDRVMGDRIGAVVVTDTEQVARDSSGSPVNAKLYFVEAAKDMVHPDGAAPLLVRHVKSKDQVVESMLGGVYAADSLEHALAIRSHLSPTECIVTPQGALIGSNWYSPAVGDEARAGVMETSRLIRKYESQVRRDELHQQTRRQQLEHNRTAIAKLESGIALLRQKLTDTNAQLNSASDELGELRTSRIRSSERRVQLESQTEQLRQTATRLQSEQQELQRQADIESAACSEIELRKSGKLQQLRQTQFELNTLQDTVSEAMAIKHRIELEAQKSDSDRELIRASIADHQQRLGSIEAEQREVEKRLVDRDDPVGPLKARLNEYLVESRLCEEKLSEARDHAQESETNYRKLDEMRLKHQLSVEEVNTRIQDVKVNSSALTAQVEEINQKVIDLDSTPELEMEQLDDEFDAEVNQAKLERLLRRIESVGGVNLIAVEQYEQEKQRRDYMDSQHDDLSRAVETLRDTIQKIDQESRQQFTEMFNSVNSEYQRLLPLLFGGGSGHLELIGEYPENAGLRVYARPKGKRVHNIQALSGGEKSLTAVAMILAFFRINPSPVCLLDEIDAPLDDENVYRLCNSLRDLADSTQLVLITHNKITMESVDSLIGVTMPEPNVSRILSVDLQEAQEFVA
ncbi:MAG: chromosome segregation protein SMC [Acidiferrobacterales bacterium]|nr:chromosome segregation protein SMC [Acidiferrobacterales bacterium]